MGDEDRIWDAALAHETARARTTIENLKLIVRSPIEARFLAAFWTVGHYNRTALDEDGFPVAHSRDTFASTEIQIHAQAPIGPYRADFEITAATLDPKKPKVRVVVELDGHDFHEKTKEQAARDKKRDRFFVGQGVALLRFTGSELWKDSRRCALEVDALIGSRLSTRRVADVSKAPR